jgi:hypothetical protein
MAKFYQENPELSKYEAHKQYIQYQCEIIMKAAQGSNSISAEMLKNVTDTTIHTIINEVQIPVPQEVWELLYRTFEQNEEISCKILTNSNPSFDPTKIFEISTLCFEFEEKGKIFIGFNHQYSKPLIGESTNPNVNFEFLNCFVNNIIFQINNHPENIFPLHPVFNLRWYIPRLLAAAFQIIFPIISKDVVV